MKPETWSATIMPHRRTPRAYALNHLRKTGHYDFKLKETTNKLTPNALLLAVEVEYPGVDATQIFTKDLTPDVCTPGLVLQNMQGSGALQEKHIQFKEVISNEFGWSTIT